MPETHATTETAGVRLPIMVVAELQDSLLVVMHDLHRLEGLLSQATDILLERFSTANRNLTAELVGDSAQLSEARSALRSAVTELQFQDMASQLIFHTTRVLKGCAYRLAAETMGREEGEEALSVEDQFPGRPNPVTQSAVDAGSVDLF